MAKLLISAAHKSSGKTTLSVGLCAALNARGCSVQPFKKGPDYIDPMWLALASGRACYNLDPYLMDWDEIDGLFERARADADLSLVEGNKGLYDGLALDGSNSNAAVATRLDLPVVLVIDARGMTRGIAPLILGYQAFDKNVRIGGVILNNLGGARHEAKLRAVVEHYTDVPVLGAVHCDRQLAMVERQLGLVPINETGEARRQVARIGDAVAAQVDLERLIEVAGGRPPSPPPAIAMAADTASPAVRGVRIGVAMDRAFGFYYADDLQALRAAGAELVAVDTLHDRLLPAVDGLFLGGGFPEMFAAELEHNASLRADIRDAVRRGLPVYAECGGLMYLARSLDVNGRAHAMVGVIPGDVVMHRRPVGRGYVELEESGEAAWSPQRSPGTPIRAHEFHYSSLENLKPGVRFAYRVKRGYGVDGRHDGVLVHNVLASYTHLRGVGDCDWARNFVGFVASRKTRGDIPPAGQAAWPDRFGLRREQISV